MNKKIRPGKSISDEKLEKSLVYFIDSIENIMLNLRHYDKLAYIYMQAFLFGIIQPVQVDINIERSDCVAKLNEQE